MQRELAAARAELLFPTDFRPDLQSFCMLRLSFTLRKQAAM